MRDPEALSYGATRPRMARIATFPVPRLLLLFMRNGGLSESPWKASEGSKILLHPTSGLTGFVLSSKVYFLMRDFPKARRP